MSHPESSLERWREEGDAKSPAGPLFPGGEHAPADIVMLENGPTAQCGTNCTGSVRHMCC